MSQQEIVNWSLEVTLANDISPHDSITEPDLVSSDSSCDLDDDEPAVPLPLDGPSTTSSFYGIRARVRAQTEAGNKPQHPKSTRAIRLWIGEWQPLTAIPTTSQGKHSKKCACVTPQRTSMPQNRWLRYVASDGKLWIDWGWSTKPFEDKRPRYFLRCKHFRPGMRVWASCDEVRAAKARAAKAAVAGVEQQQVGLCGCSRYALMTGHELKSVFPRDRWKCGPALRVREPGTEGPARALDRCCKARRGGWVRSFMCLLR